MVQERRAPTTEKVQAMIDAAIATHAALKEQHGVSSGLYTNRPAAGVPNRYYFSTDKGKWSRDNGSGWDELIFYWG